MIAVLLTLVFCVLVARFYLTLFAYTPRHASQGKRAAHSARFTAYRLSLQISWDPRKGMWV